MRCAGARWPSRRRPLAVAAIAAGAAAPQPCTRADSRSQILDRFIPRRGTAAPWIFEKQYLSVSRLHLKKIGRQNDARSDRTFAIEFLDPGVYAYAFRFGLNIRFRR
jgi:hypothetical protein